MEPDTKPTEQKPGKLTLWQVAASVLSAAIGVQKNKNRQRDFNSARPGVYIVAGLIFTLLFVIGLIIVVQLVLSHIS